MSCRDSALDEIEEGWHILVNKYYDYLDIISMAIDSDNTLAPDIEVEVVEVSRGMLRFVAHHNNSTIQEMLDKLAWAIERDSAKVCEVCGEKGFRRKSLEGSPNRCQPHYIELMNELADAGKL
jgi:hypothetical protein